MKVHWWAAPLFPLAPLYRAAVTVQDLSYTRGWRRAHSLRWPVISVGNLSVGGSGKTPVVMELARLFAASGVSVDVLSRGYGRESEETLHVDAKGSATRFGDEPLLIARTTGVPVFVGASRYEAGRLAEQSAPADERLQLHLLDDGFQHRRLHRTIDLVLLHRDDLDDALLPAGRLREPLSALSRADIIVLRAEDRDLEARVRKFARAYPRFWYVRRRMIFARTVCKVVAFCAIARPEEFFAGLRSAGAEVVRTTAWRDHHRYTRADVDRLLHIANEQSTEAFVTTAKDAVRLDTKLRVHIEAVLPLLTAELRVEFENSREVIPELLRMLTERGEAAVGL